mmetsp:Transcript_53785/g.172425  ORF Transcript_53785/g.172425 Transcript_53785/m.172425 type:complete len:534 (+) Transcript_53785:63-1664(+)
MQPRWSAACAAILMVFCAAPLGACIRDEGILAFHAWQADGVAGMVEKTATATSPALLKASAPLAPANPEKPHVANNVSDHDDATLGPDWASAHLQAKEEVAMSLSLTLLGSVTVNSALLYLVNSSNENIKRATWDILGGAGGIFCSVLLFESWQQAEELVAEVVFLVTMPKVVSGLFNFVLAVAIVQIPLRRILDRPVHVAGWSHVGSHIIGFWGMNTFGSLIATLGEQPVFSDWPALCFVGVVASAASIFGVSLLAKVMRMHVYAGADAADVHRAEHWGHQCEHIEDEFSGFIVGFLITLVTRHCITMQMPDLHGSPGHKTAQQVIGLLAAAGCSLVLQLLVSQRAQALKDLSPAMHRYFHTVLEIVTMTTGWMCHYAATWYFWNLNQFFTRGMGPHMAVELVTATAACQMGAAMCVALLFSALAFVLVMAISITTHYTETSTAHSIVKALVIGVGLSWEKAFYVAIDSVSSEFESRNTHDTVGIALKLILVSIVLPAWMFHILPRSISGHGPHEHCGGDGCEREKLAREAM